MKWFFILLSVYIIFIATMPCADETDNCTKTHKELINDNKNHEDKNAPDTCSPFCVCSCCNVTVIFNHFFFDCNLFKSLESFIISYYQDSISFYYHPIWQPPKIS